MSEEQLKAFLEAVRADAGLQEKLNAATDPDFVVEIAKEAGFLISAEELQRSQAEISEEELEGVAAVSAGGNAVPCSGNYDRFLREHPNVEGTIHQMIRM